METMTFIDIDEKHESIGLENRMILKLKDCCVKITDGSHFSPKSVEEGYPYVTVKDIKDDKVDLQNCLKISTTDFESLVKNDCRPFVNDLLFSKDGTVGKVSLVSEDLDFVVLSSIAIIRPNLATIYPKYLFYVLKSREFLNQALNQKKGVAIRRIILKDLKELTLSVPSVLEQKQIVSKIEELFSELDKGNEELKTAQQQLKVYRQAVLKWAFEGKLTNEGVKDGELPEGWELVNIQDLAENNKHALKAGPFGSSLKKEFYVQKGYKIYGQEQVIGGDPFYGDYYISEEKYQELFTNRVKAGDVLISLVGTVGKVLVLPDHCLPGIINPRLIKISLNPTKYLPQFFKYYFESSTVKTYYSSKAQGTTMDVLNLGIIKTIPFPLCSIEQQKQIIQEIESRFSVCDKMEEIITVSLKQAEALRQSILKKAFEGKLQRNKL